METWLIGRDWEILSLSPALVSAHDPHDDPSDHEGEDEQDRIEDYGDYLHVS
jgi:hypothetical protein